MSKVIGYMRVSTAEQGHSGLGLEAQRKVIERYCDVHGHTIESLETEVASAKGRTLRNRPVLNETVVRAYEDGSTIVVAKLDRLSREVELIANLMNRGIPFEVAELGPEVDNFMLHIHASVAEKERSLISERTKAALASKRARGESLGNMDNLIRHAEKGREKQRQAALQRVAGYEEILGKVAGMTLRDAAASLNRWKVATPTGKGRWHPAGVSRALTRLELV